MVLTSTPFILATSIICQTRATQLILERSNTPDTTSSIHIEQKACRRRSMEKAYCRPIIIRYHSCGAVTIYCAESKCSTRTGYCSMFSQILVMYILMFSLCSLVIKKSLQYAILLANYSGTIPIRRRDVYMTCGIIYYSGNICG